MTYDEVQRQISGVTYSDAIDHYNQLKSRFFDELAIAGGYTKEAAIDQFQTDVIKKLEDVDLSGLPQAKELYLQVESAVVQALRGDRKNLQAIRSELRNKYQQEFNKDNEQLIQEASNIFTDQQIDELIINYLSKSCGVKSEMGFDITDLSNRMKSFRDRVFIQKVVLSRGGHTPYLRASKSTKGYFREAILHKAFYEFFLKLDETLPQEALKHFGATPVKGRQTEMDEYINFLNGVKNFEIQVTHNFEDGYGIQSKSYIPPWNRDMTYVVQSSNFAYFFGVGSRSGLLQSFMSQDRKGWIANVNYLGVKENTLTALGKNNVFYFTGGGLYSTADLITQFRANQYYLSFIYSNKGDIWEPTPTVSWQQIDLTKS